MANVAIESKRFVVRKSLIGKNQLITFTTKTGDKVTYNHDKVYKIMKSKLEKYKVYYNSSYQYGDYDMSDYYKSRIQELKLKINKLI